MFAEGVNRIRRAGRSRLRDDGVADQIDVVVGAVGVFRRQRMGRQTGGFHLDRQQLAQLARHPQHFQFALRAEAVTGFDLHAGDAFRQQRPQAEQRLLQQQRFIGLAGGFHGGNDAAALRGDVGVAHAVQPLFELAAAVAAEHRVRVAVNKAGGDDAAVEFHRFVRDKAVRQRRMFANPDNLAVAYGDRAVGQGVIVAVAHGDDIGAVPQAVTVNLRRHCFPPPEPQLPHGCIYN